jgi:hypothetical protein
VFEAAFVLLEFSSPSRRIFYRLPFNPPSLVRRIGPSLAVNYTNEQFRVLLEEMAPIVGVSYVITKFATMPKSLLVYYTITDKSTSARCRMDLPGPTTSVGTRTNYLLGPWDCPACATRYLMVWSTRTTEEKYSVRKLYMSLTVWKTPRRTRLVLSPYSDL